MDNELIDITNVYQSSNGSIGIEVQKNIFEVGQEIELNVDQSFRSGVSKSHTAAHIVHSSLRNILGDHVAQAGSNVSPGKFRFDFSHTDKVSNDELNEIFTLSKQGLNQPPYSI